MWLFRKVHKVPNLRLLSFIRPSDYLYSLAHNLSHLSLTHCSTVTMSSKTFGETLHFITNVKLEELERQRLNYAKHHDEVISQAMEADGDPVRQLEVLIQGMRNWSGTWSPNARPHELSQFIDHARKNPSFPKPIIDSWISAAKTQLSYEEKRFKFAALFGQLLTEWLGSKGNSGKPVEFEHVSRHNTSEQKAKLESIIFEAKSVDVNSLKGYLDDLFSKEAASEALEEFRKRISAFSYELRTREIDVDELKQVIRSALQTDLLSDKKQATLRDFLTKSIILKELAGILDMQLHSLETWSWPEDGVSLEARRHLNGKVRFYLDSEIMNTLLLHYVGTLWACEFHSAIKDLRSSQVWKKVPRNLTQDDMARRRAFLGSEGNHTTLRQKREKYQNDNYVMCQLPASLEASMDSYSDEPKPQSSPWASRGPRFESPVELKQSLLNILSADVAINKFKFNECAVVRTDLEWFGPSLPFDTIIAVLRFFGMPEKDLQFVSTFLSCPVKFKDDPSSSARVRKRGVPISHALSTLCGEIVLFVMDFAVNQRTDGLFLYRIHDDFWLWDTKADRCAKAWAEMQRFCQLAGMSFNASKTGSVVVRPEGNQAVLNLPEGEVRWGFLKMDTSAEFVVDQDMIDEHITEMRRQLDATSSVFEWVQAYNKYMAFIVRNCGAPVIVCGVKHVDTIIDALARIQRILFEDGLNAKVGKMLEQRFGVDAVSIPQGWYFWPCALGGLEVKDFITKFLMLRDGYGYRPVKTILEDAVRKEEKAYEKAKESWKEAPTTRSILWRLEDIKSKIKADDPFFSKDEYDRGWEECSHAWVDAYSRLLETPTIKAVTSTPRLESAIEVLSSEGLAAFHSSSPSWSSFDHYWQYIVGIYHEEILQKLGSLELVGPSLVPISMLSIFKSSKLRWEQ